MHTYMYKFILNTYINCLRFKLTGLRVCLGTDDPLQFHMTEDPLQEEYVTAARVFGFDVTDLSEIAKNSVLNSSFDDFSKRKWLGDRYDMQVIYCIVLCYDRVW